MDWFAERGWTPTGFVPPAWLLGEGAWQALRESSFAYTTTFSHFHCLGGQGGVAPLRSPSMVYAARNRSGRWLSPRVADATAAMLAGAPLVRFSLHPPDARYPELVRHTQRTLERLLAQRTAVTKAECASRLAAASASIGTVTSTDPSSRPHASTAPSPGSRPETARSAGDRPSC
jgi:predicted deacetylase